MTNDQLRSVIREEVRAALGKSKKPKAKINEGIFDSIKGLLGQAKAKVPPKTQEGKRIVGMDFDGYFIDEDGNRIS